MNIKPYPNNFCYLKWERKNDFRQARLVELQEAEKEGSPYVIIGTNRIRTKTAIRKLKQQIPEW